MQRLQTENIIYIYNKTYSSLYIGLENIKIKTNLPDRLLSVSMDVLLYYLEDGLQSLNYFKNLGCAPPLFCDW